jgi:dCTP deaminase
MVLSDRDIIKAINKREIVIVPFNPENLTPNGYDLTVKEIKIGERTKEEAVEKIRVPKSEWFVISTQETIKVGLDYTGEIWIRSTYARKGVLGSFGLVDAGFEGELTLPFFNTHFPLELKRGDKIVQISFRKLSSSASSSYKQKSGKFMHQQGITLE